MKIRSKYLLNLFFNLTIFFIGLLFVCKTEVFAATKYFGNNITTIHQGSITTSLTNSPNSERVGFLSQLFSVIYSNMKHPLSILLLQIISIIIAARLLGSLFRKMGQPTVIGEIIAGIVLGPSLLGLFFPQLSAFLFPLESLNNLHFLSQIGLILFMFIIGMELDTGFVKKKTDAAMIIMAGSVLFPFAIGMILAIFLFPEFGNPHNSFFSFAIFMGIAMSITAFPVLARIIQEKQLSKTFLGNLAITVAAGNDVVGWCLLAATIAIIKAGSYIDAFATIGLTLVYVFLMLFVIRPVLKRVGNIYVSKENLNKSIIALVFLFLLFSSFLSEIVGIHALIGAFIAGVVMPRNINFKNILIEKIEDISLVLLLPLFFVFTGLRTQIGSLNEQHLWYVCGLITLFAIVGKFGGTALFARITGLSWKDSFSLGALMNTRGLIELIVLNIGYDLGILSTEIFTMLVIMAVVTTFMTGPSLNLVNFFYRKRETIKPPVHSGLKFLLSFANPQMGCKLLKLSAFLSGKEIIHSEYTAMHLTPSAGIETKNIDQFENEVFNPIKTTATELNVKLNTIYKITEQIQKEIIAITRKNQFDLLLLGAAKTVFVDNFIGGKIKGIIEKANCSLGVFIDRDFKAFSKILILADNENDIFLLDFCRNIDENQNCQVSIIIPDNVSQNAAYSLPADNKDKVQMLKSPLSLEMVNNSDLVILSLEYWKRTKIKKTIWNKQLSSLLIVNSFNKSDSINKNS